MNDRQLASLTSARCALNELEAQVERMGNHLFDLEGEMRAMDARLHPWRKPVWAVRRKARRINRKVRKFLGLRVRPEPLHEIARQHILPKLIEDVYRPNVMFTHLAKHTDI